MGLLSSIGKAVSFAAKNLVRGSENVTNARKALYGAAKSGSTKKFESIFTNFLPKAKAGMKELVKEYKATSSTGILKSFSSGFKGIGSAIKTAIADGVKAVAPGASKFAKFLGGAKGLGSGIVKCCKKMPIIGTILTVGFEIPEIYGAYKDGGFWEGTKQVFKSCGKLLVGAACSAVGTAIGGPIGGAVGWMAGDMLMDKIFPPHSKTKEAQAQSAVPENITDEDKEIYAAILENYMGNGNKLTDEAKQAKEYLEKRYNIKIDVEKEVEAYKQQVQEGNAQTDSSTKTQTETSQGTEAAEETQTATSTSQGTEAAEETQTQTTSTTSTTSQQQPKEETLSQVFGSIIAQTNPYMTMPYGMGGFGVNPFMMTPSPFGMNGFYANPYMMMPRMSYNA